MLAFEGLSLPPWARGVIEGGGAAGATLFRHDNVRDAEQVRALTDELQALVPSGAPPLLVAADQEGGQLIALGEDTTPFPGNMALGAVGDVAVAGDVARAIGAELRALGVNVNYAPVCDLATNPSNPALGVRSFGEDPAAVAELVAATVRGLQAEGVAATLKHFPGKGEAGLDSHLDLPVLTVSRDRLEGLELRPFEAGIEAGARLVMTGHAAVPSLTGRVDLPASLAEAILVGLLRDRLGFDGVAITDALDMGGFLRGRRPGEGAVEALRAGNDLLLLAGEEEAQRAILEEVGRGRSGTRVEALRRWAGGFPRPALDVVGCERHRALARQVAERSITLVRDDASVLPLRPASDGRVLAIMPAPADLTPADTSSTVRPTLAEALRRRHPNVESIVVPQVPAAEEIAAVVERARASELVVAGTIDALRQPAQAALVNALLGSGRPVVAVALRTPWDLAAYPTAPTYLCAYGILEPTMEALAAALFGEIRFCGRLPTTISGLYPRGHGLVR
jgi:beta-N-acetylhexosaminidase